MLKRAIRLLIINTTVAVLILALSGTLTAKTKKKKVYTEMTDVVMKALVREMGVTPEIINVRGEIAGKYSYDEGSIGRKLTAAEWRESQAWQSLSGYNTAKQARQHDIDAMVWCTLRGGGNSGTYMKPLIDFDDHIKLAFYTYRSTLQKYFAASRGVDVAYGPDDKITPIIIGLGEERVVDLTIQCINEDGKVAEQATFKNGKEVK